MKRLWNATHENTGAAGKGEARGGEIVAVAEWKSGREGGEIRLAPRSLAWSRRRRSWPLRRRNGSKDLRPSSSRHSVPSPSSSPLERATCPSDQRTPPPTIDPKSVGTSVILADITRLMLARTRAEDDPRAFYTRGEVGRMDGLGEGRGEDMVRVGER